MATAFTSFVGETAAIAAYALRVTSASPYLAASRPLHDAAELLKLFGAFAVDEAAARADRSRALGNHVHFCRWREVGRLLELLDNTEASGTIH